MSPIITQDKTCPECLNDARLTGWKPLTGYDPHMRQYQCTKCGDIFYIIEGEKSYKTEALPVEES